MTTVTPTQFIRTDARIFRVSDIRYVELLPQSGGAPGVLIQTGDEVKGGNRYAVGCQSFDEARTMFERIALAVDAQDLRDGAWQGYGYIVEHEDGSTQVCR